MLTPVVVAPVRHSLLEDAYAFATGCSLIVLGLTLHNSAGRVPGGVAGLALLASYFVALPAGVLFTLLNIPFFLLAGRSMGRASVIKSVIANLLISGFSLLAPSVIRLESLDGLFAALFGGTVIGVGILVLARHQVGVGGIGILALALQKSRGWNAGRTQLAFDALILSAALSILDMSAKQFAVSIASSAAVAGVLIVFHRPGRYTGY